MTRLADRLPEFPWDRLAPYAEVARAHDDGVVDLSVGTPVDPVPAVGAGGAGGGVGLAGLPAHRGHARAARGDQRVGRAHAARRRSTRPRCCRPSAPRSSSRCCRRCSGSAPATPSWCRSWRTRRTTSAPAWPAARSWSSDSTHALGPQRVSLVWVNSPSNPTGRVLPVEHLAKVVAWARERGAIVVSDECYLELGWDAEPVSVLDPRVSGGSLRRASWPCTRCRSGPTWPATAPGFVLGDPSLVGLAARGAQAPRAHGAGAGAGGDGRRARRRRARGRAARALRAGAATTCSRRCSTPASRVEHSEAGLYLWATRDEPLLGHRRLAGRARHPRGAGRVLRRRRCAARAGGAHRHRRARRRRRTPPRPVDAVGDPGVGHVTAPIQDLPGTPGSALGSVPGTRGGRQRRPSRQGPVIAGRRRPTCRT